MPKFIVLNTAILHDGKRYEVGSEIELNEAQAENNAINLKAVEKAVKAPEPPKEPEETADEGGAAVAEEDVALASAPIAEAEKTKGKKR